MKISIITTCYNRAATIQGAIESVLAQDYPDIEYIIIDGASNDGSVQAIKSMMEDGRWKKFWKFISERDHGMYEAINKGIRMATGDVIGLVHSDDFFYDNHVISDVVKRFEETNADFLYGDGVFVNANDTNKPVRNWIGGAYHRWKVACGWLPLHPTCYIRRDVMMREGLYDESYKIAADSDLLFRYLYMANLKVTYLKRKIIRMRMGGLSTDSAKRKLMWAEDVRMYRSHGRWGVPTKVMKMMWKVPQFVEAKFIKA
jgi:glycosyltransferase